MLNDVRSRPRDHQLSRIAGHARGANADFRRVAYAVDFDNIINLILNNAGRHIRKRLNAFRQQNHLAGIFCIDHRVAKRAASGFAAAAAGIAIFVAAGDRQERDININFTLFNQIDPAAVRVDLYRLLHQAV